jgi:hypothetical protein
MNGLLKDHVITEKIYHEKTRRWDSMYIEDVLNKKLNKDLTKDHVSFDDLV